jgi:hypothetical protein
MTSFDNYSDIGRYLMDCRESMQLSVDRAAKDLNIRKKYLAALEAGKMDELPSVIYAKGYVQRYAGYLGLNEIELLGAFDHISGKIKTEKFYVPEPTRKHNTPTPRILIFSVALICFFYALWMFMGSTSKPSVEQVQQLPERYARLIDPAQLPQYIADVNWRDCFTPLLAEKAACQNIYLIQYTPDDRITFLKQNQIFSSNLKLVIERE